MRVCVFRKLISSGTKKQRLVRLVADMLDSGELTDTQLRDRSRKATQREAEKKRLQRLQRPSLLRQAPKRAQTQARREAQEREVALQAMQARAVEMRVRVEEEMREKADERQRKEEKRRRLREENARRKREREEIMTRMTASRQEEELAALRRKKTEEKRMKLFVDKLGEKEKRLYLSRGELEKLCGGTLKAHYNLSKQVTCHPPPKITLFDF
jgi:hypothetical protein